jgi:hypothetical protein
MTVVDFHLTPAALPDATLQARFANDGNHGPAPGLWDDWAASVRGDGGGDGAAPDDDGIAKL